MKKIYYIITLSVLISLVSCYKDENKAGDAQSLDELTKKPAAKITREDGWTIVSRVEKGDRVYWFIAPEVDSVSPAMFKKTVYADDKNNLDAKTVSECEAPKQTCDELMVKFKEMSKKYN